MFLKARSPEQRSEWEGRAPGLAGGDQRGQHPHQEHHRQAQEREEGPPAQDEGGGETCRILCLSSCIKQFYFRMRTVESLCPSWRRAPAPCSRAPSRSPPWAPSGSITWVLCLISRGAMMRLRVIERGGWCRRSHDRVHQRWQWWRPPRLPPGHQLPPASRADLAPGGWHGLGEQLLRPTASLASLPAATQLTTPCLCPLWHSSFVQTLCQYSCVIMSFRF